METFPNEGKIDISLLDKDVIEKIEGYLKSNKKNITPVPNKDNYNGLSWNGEKYWFLFSFDSGLKQEYTYNQISKFIEPNVNESLVGRYVKCIAECDYWTVGKYYKITEGEEFKPRKLMIETNDNPCYLSTSFDCFELMPVGFEPNEFKKGDYIVQLCETQSDYLIQNHVYLQKKDFPFLYASIDSMGTETQGSYVKCMIPETWRYATQQEVAEYNRISKPYDVTTLKSIEPNTIKSIEPWSVGTYVVATTNNESKNINKGLVDVITNEWGSEDNTIGINSSDKVLPKSDFKWFATKNEAEEFAKTLIEVKPEPTKVYDYEVVHCTTQEEWDFVAKKLGRKSDVTYQKVGDSIKVDNPECSYFYDKIQHMSEFKIYTFKEWCDMNNYTFESHKFEVGKWYKHFLYSGTYSKFQSIVNNTFIGSEWITDKGNYKNEEFTSNFYKEVYLIDVTEIQQYLPEGHVDKIKSEYIPQVGDWVKLIHVCHHYSGSKFFKLEESFDYTDKGFITQILDVEEIKHIYAYKVKTPKGYTGLRCEAFIKAQPHEIPNVKQELEKGKYYQITYSDYPDCLYVAIGNGGMKTLNYLGVTMQSYNTSNIFTPVNIQIQPASEEQIAWLDRCIAANKFVPKELSKDELLEIAKQKYPVGTKYLDNRKEFFIKGSLCLHTLSNSSYYITDGFGGAVYEDGEWAEIVDKPGTTANIGIVTIDHTSNFTTDFKWEFKSPANTMAQRMKIGSWIHEGMLNDKPSTENTTDEILKILNQYMEIEIPDTMEEVVLPQLLKHNKSLINI